MTLSPKLGVVEISTLWHFRLPLLIQMFIRVASSPRLSGTGMPSPILWSHLLKMQMIVLLSSLLWWELGTNSLITGPGEWVSLRRFTSKLSWSWAKRTRFRSSYRVRSHFIMCIFKSIPYGLIRSFCNQNSHLFCILSVSVQRSDGIGTKRNLIFRKWYMYDIHCFMIENSPNFNRPAVKT